MRTDGSPHILVGSSAKLFDVLRLVRRVSRGGAKASPCSSPLLCVRLGLSIVLLAACGTREVLEIRLDAGRGGEVGIWSASMLGADIRAEIVVPEPGLAGFGVYVRDGSDGPIGLYELEGSDGSTLITEYARRSDGRRVGGPGEAWTVVPFDDQREGITPGRWSLWIGGSVDLLEIWYRDADRSRPPEIQFAILTDLSRFSEQDLSPVLQAAADSLGLTVGSIHWKDVELPSSPTQAADVYALLERPGVANQPIVHVVVTDDLDVPGGTPVGFAFVPGLPRSGSTFSGVALAFSGDVGRDALVLAHELGHFLGLGHTTEPDGRDDGISDTPSCGDAIADALEGCPDADNLMFPIVGATELTPGQWIVVGGSIAYTGNLEGIPRVAPLVVEPSADPLLSSYWCIRARDRIARLVSRRVARERLEEVAFVTPEVPARTRANARLALEHLRREE